MDDKYFIVTTEEGRTIYRRVSGLIHTRLISKSNVRRYGFKRLVYAQKAADGLNRIGTPYVVKEVRLSEIKDIRDRCENCGADSYFCTCEEV